MSDEDLLHGPPAQPEYPDYRTEYIQSPQPISTRKLARKWGVPYNTICTQCRKEKWVELRRQFQCKVTAKSEEEAVETLAEAHVRWAREYRTLQAKGLKGLQTHEPRTAGEAARLLDLGIKGEMLQRGKEPEDGLVVEINWGDERMEQQREARRRELERQREQEAPADDEETSEDTSSS
jgi:hypothetical protein